MPTDLWNVLAAIAEAIGATAAIVALFVALKTQAQQQALTRLIHEQQILLQQRQALLPLWEHITDLSDIDPACPVWPDVRKACNTLELVAGCWEGHIVDKEVVRRIFDSMIIDLYEKIDQCQNPPTGEMDGRTLLRHCRAAQLLYTELKQEEIKRNQLGSIIPSRS